MTRDTLKRALKVTYCTLKSDLRQSGNTEDSRAARKGTDRPISFACDPPCMSSLAEVFALYESWQNPPYTSSKLVENTSKHSA